MKSVTYYSEFELQNFLTDKNVFYKKCELCSLLPYHAKWNLSSVTYFSNIKI